MKTMQVSEFKARCIATLKRVRETGEPVVVTLRGTPLARVVAVADGRSEKQLGALKGSMRVRRNLVRSDSSADWEMLR